MAAANEVARVMAEAAALVQETYKDMAGSIGAAVAQRRAENESAWPCL